MIPLGWLLSIIGAVGLLATVAFVALGTLALLGQPDDHDFPEAETDAQRDLGVREVTDE